MIKVEEFIKLYNRSKVAEDLENNVSAVIRNLIQIWRYPCSTEIEDWRYAVYRLLHSVRKLKYPKRYPSSKFIMNNTYEINKRDISRWLSSITRIYDEDYHIVREDVDLLQSRIQDYFEWLSDMLSLQGFVFDIQIYDQLDYLGFKKR